MPQQTTISLIDKRVVGLGLGLAVAGFFTAYQPITPRLAIVSSLSVVAFAIPSFWAVVKDLGRKEGLLALLAICFYALLVETSALKTGFPYGNFIYTNSLGNKIFGLTPWTVAFAYPPILLLAYWIGRQLKQYWQIISLTALSAMLVDLVLDPAAVKLGFWHWLVPGYYYGVPIVNFLGWLLSSAIGAFLLHALYRTRALSKQLTYSGLAILWFWTWIEWSVQQWLPAILGTVLSIFLWRYVSSKQV